MTVEGWVERAMKGNREYPEREVRREQSHWYCYSSKSLAVDLE